jgi:glycerol-3-phosphate cytidylyltransferase
MQIGFTCSPFDLLHAGHIEMLRECRDHCDWLIVGLNANPCKRGRYPVQSLMERFVQLEGVKYIDEIIPYQDEEDLINLMLLKSVDIRFVGDDYKDKHFTGDSMDIPVYYNKRSHNLSSNELKDRVISNQSKEIIEGKKVADTDVYTIIDSEVLEKLTVSSTTLAPGKSTKGHSHDDIDEVYHFISGHGVIYITPPGKPTMHYRVGTGKVFTINSTEHHKVSNQSFEEDLVFVCTFNSRRNH